MRTTKGLIAEVREELKRPGVLAFLVVYFEDREHGEMIPGNEPDAVAQLNEMVNEGGKPVGILWVERGEVRARPLVESANDPDVNAYLNRLVAVQRQMLTGM